MHAKRTLYAVFFELILPNGPPFRVVADLELSILNQGETKQNRLLLLTYKKSKRQTVLRLVNLNLQLRQTSNYVRPAVMRRRVAIF